MNPLKLSMAILALIFTTSANAQTPYSTHFKNGGNIATFLSVDLPGFDSAWRAPDGTIWTDMINGDYTNIPTKGEELINNQIQHSPAIGACAALGARLPTKEDYLKLQSYFEQDGNALSQQGMDDLGKLFPKMINEFMWTSSGDPKDLLGVFYFNGYSGSLVFGSYQYLYSVQCVK
jgi:hypothetical protein